MRLFLCLSLIFLGLLPCRAATPAEYDRALGEVQAALTSQMQAIDAEQVPSGEAPTQVAQRTLGSIHRIETPQGMLPVDAGPLIAAIKAADAAKGPDARAKAFAAVRQQIVTLRAVLALPYTASIRPAAETRRTVQAVLSADEFASDPPPQPSAAERAAAWLDRWLSRLLAGRTPAPNPNPVPPINPALLQGLFYILLAAAFIALVYVLVMMLGRRGARAKPLGLAEEEATLVEARDNDSLLALAEQQAQAGDYRRAFRLVYLAALVVLDTGGVLRFDRSKTNWEYLRALRAAGRGDLYAALTPLTREFDGVWYGFSRTDASQYAHALAQYHALRAVSPVGPPKTETVKA